MYSSLMGYVDATYDELVEIFGEPEKVIKAGDKTDVQWKIGKNIYIYNYKTGPNYLGLDGVPPEEHTDWHIGGDTKNAVHWVQDQLVRHRDGS